MLIFSAPHAWQGDKAVQQILVFTSQEMKERFDKSLLELSEVMTQAVLAEHHNLDRDKVVVEVPDSNLGAIYKLRAVMDGQGRYTAVIRCGFTGHHIADGVMSHALPLEAFKEAIRMMYVRIENASKELIHHLEQKGVTNETPPQAKEC